MDLSEMIVLDNTLVNLGEVNLAAVKEALDAHVGKDVNFGGTTSLSNT